MYILIGAFVIVLLIFMKYGDMSYAQKNWKEWGYHNSDIKEAENKR